MDKRFSVGPIAAEYETLRLHPASTRDSAQGDVLQGDWGKFNLSLHKFVGMHAAELRARYNLGLADALQFAVALKAGCDIFLTNDIALKRVTELEVVVLNETISQ